MANLEFSVPYNNDRETLEELFKMKRLGNNEIMEVYLSGPQEYSGSGRIVPEMDMDEFVEVVDRIHKGGMRANLVLNSTCEGSDWYSQKVVNSTMECLRRVHEEHGVEAVTMANPLYISKVRERFPDIEICASVLGNIDCVQRAVIYGKAGADIITPDVNINRNLALLKEMKEATNARLKLLVNEGCLYKCPFRQFHFNAKSHISKEVRKAGGVSKVFVDASFASLFDAGTQVIREDLSQLLKSCWIRPEDISKYGEITTFFKLVCRSQLKSFVVRAARAYLEESWSGDLLDLVSGCSKRFSMNEGAYLDNKGLEDYKFFETVTSCDKRCSQCGYCEQLARTLIRLKVVTRGKLEELKLKDVADELERLGKLPAFVTNQEGA
jgi:collagenase-like PrtC family protease